MSTDFVARHQEVRDGLRDLRTAQRSAMRGFSSLHQAAMSDGELSAVTKELMALAIGICSHCEGCVAFHVHDALKAGATRAQVEETVGVAIMMGGGPATVFGGDALRALDQFEAAGVEPVGS